MARRRHSRVLRVGLWSLAVLVVLVVAGGSVVALSFDPDSLKPRIVAAVKQATGRDLTLNGRIRLGLSLQPTLVVQDVAFANPPGFSRPQMATLERLDVKLALIPLLSRRIEIASLVLEKPDIILETDAQGRPNWQFTRESGPASPQAAAPGTRDATPIRISVADVQIGNGMLTWRDDRTGQSEVFGLTSLRASAVSPQANLHVSMSATSNGAPFTLTGEFGPIARLLERDASDAWPVQAQLEVGGAKVAVDGSVAQPLQGRGYRMKLTANIPDLAALGPLLPGAKLPPLHDIALAAQVADTGAALPEVSGVALHVGQSDLTGVVTGLKLDKLDAAAARLDQPMQISALGSLANLPATVAGSLGAPAALLRGSAAAASVPLDLNLEALGSRLTIKGTAARRQDGRPSVQADVASDKIDLDALLAALGKPPVPAGAAPAPAPAAPVAVTQPALNRLVIPATPIPFDLLRLADADLKLGIAQLVWGGATYRAIATHLDLHGGRLRLDPLSADLPAGHLDAALTADAAQATPTVVLRLQIPALATQPLLAALRQPAWLSGNLQVQADLHGAGATPHAIAASLDGSLGLTMADGTVDNRMLGNALGSILREVNLLDLVGRGGTSQLQCFVVRLDAANGIATVRSLALVSSLLTMDGRGSLNLGAETLDLRVRPQARIAGTGLVVPLRVGGTFASPSAAPDPAGTVAENAGTVVGALLGGTNPLRGAQLAPGGECGAAEAARRTLGGAALPGPQQRPKPPDIGGALKQLFR
jgi:uncharacterized protein involved in outer membrane biogenesis